MSAAFLIWSWTPAVRDKAYISKPFRRMMGVLATNYLFSLIFKRRIENKKPIWYWIESTESVFSLPILPNTHPPTKNDRQKGVLLMAVDFTTPICDQITKRFFQITPNNREAWMLSPMTSTNIDVNYHNSIVLFLLVKSESNPWTLNTSQSIWFECNFTKWYRILNYWSKDNNETQEIANLKFNQDDDV